MVLIVFLNFIIFHLLHLGKLYHKVIIITIVLLIFFFFCNYFKISDFRLILLSIFTMIYEIVKIILFNYIQ